MRPESYSTPSGITVVRSISRVAYSRGLHGLLRKLDTQRGIYFSSGYEYPERYSRWDVAALAPPLELIATGREFRIQALNDRGAALAGMLAPVLRDHPHWETFETSPGVIRAMLKPLPSHFTEGERSKQPSPFSVLRALLTEFKNPLAGRLALAGAFGYDLLLQFDPINLKHT